MKHLFFASELEGVATFWRIMRTDGATLAFTSHNAPLFFDNITHLSAPGMLPSAIRRTAQLERDTVEVEGVLSHDSIRASDLEDGRYADALVNIGLVDWESLENATLFTGTLGNVASQDNSFTAELRSAKSVFEDDLVPRTSPTCRAAFCDAACQLSPARFSRTTTVSMIDIETNSVGFSGVSSADHLHGEIRWVSGPHAGITMGVIDQVDGRMVVDRPLSSLLELGQRAFVKEGCDHTIGTCSSRFGNAVNFQGEPFLPGNDLLTRYPTSST